jgi:hypothetical protein
MVGHGREHGRAHRVDGVHGGQVADDPIGPLGEVLQQRPLDPRGREQVDRAGEGDHDAPVAHGMVELHSDLPAYPFAVVEATTVLLPPGGFLRARGSR